MQKSYLSIASASDIEDKRERFIYRIFEIIPGGLSILTLFLATVFSWALPVAVALFTIVFDIYWLLRVSYLAIHQVIAYQKMKYNLKVDFEEKLNKVFRNDWTKIYHLVVLPTYKEGIEIIRTTFEALKNSKYDKEKMIVVLGVEKRAGEAAKSMAERIKKEYRKTFPYLLVSVHSEKQGEIAGKGSNLAFAVETAKELIDKLKIPYKNIVISSFDVDTRVYPQYFLCLTFNYLSAEDSLHSSYQPIPLYNNNIWDAPAFSRVVSLSGSFWQMMMQEMPHKLVTYSSHSFPFKVFLEIGYPKNVVSDDSRIFWKSYLEYNGNYRVVPLYYPVSMDAVLSKTLGKTIVNQYVQQKRWAWGCSEIPYVLYGFLKNKKIKLGEKIKHSFNIIEGYWSWAVSALITFFLGWLPLILGGERFNVTLLSYNLPRMTSRIMSLAMSGMIISAIISLLILPSRPRRLNKWKSFTMFLQWILLPVTLIAFGSIPALDSQIRLMFKNYLEFRVTEKVRTK